MDQTQVLMLFRKRKLVVIKVKTCEKLSIICAYILVKFVRIFSARQRLLFMRSVVDRYYRVLPRMIIHGPQLREASQILSSASVAFSAEPRVVW